MPTLAYIDRSIKPYEKIEIIMKLDPRIYNGKEAETLEAMFDFSFHEGICIELKTKTGNRQYENTALPYLGHDSMLWEIKTKTGGKNFLAPTNKRNQTPIPSLLK